MLSALSNYRYPGQCYKTGSKTPDYCCVAQLNCTGDGWIGVMCVVVLSFHHEAFRSQISIFMSVPVSPRLNIYSMYIYSV